MKVLTYLGKRFSGNWVIVMRLHQKVEQMISDDLDGIVFFNGNSHDDMADYLLVSDVLITDYSSCFMDYLLTDKPCFLYAPDYEKYRNVERGTYFEIEEMPYPYSFNEDDFLQSIINYDDFAVLQKKRNFIKRIGLIDDGHSSERIVDEIISKLH